MTDQRALEIIETLAEGAFGLVCVGRLRVGGIERLVALKILKGEWTEHQEVLSRTRDEARLLALLNHRNIVKVERLAELNGRPTLVMEYVPGVNLETLINEGPLPLSVALTITAHVASALDAAYNRPPPGRREPLRVVHRDIKPSNVLLGIDAEVKVLDFGTARAEFDFRESHTQRLAFGSMGYLAPERMDGASRHPSMDVYALGVTLYEMLSGSRMSQLSVRPDKHRVQLEEYLRGLHVFRGCPRCDGQVKDLLRSMLAYEPDARPTAAQVVQRAWALEASIPAAEREDLASYCRRVVEPLYRSRPRYPPPEELAAGQLDLRAFSGWSDPSPAARAEHAQRGGGEQVPSGGRGERDQETTARPGAARAPVPAEEPASPAPGRGDLHRERPGLLWGLPRSLEPPSRFVLAFPLILAVLVLGTLWAAGYWNPLD